MRTVGLKVLKNKLSEYVRIASQGETVLISDRDRVVAEITPPRPERSVVVADAILADLVRTGALTPALRAPRAPLRAAPVAPLERILRELDEDRSDR